MEFYLKSLANRPQFTSAFDGLPAERDLTAAHASDEEAVTNSKWNQGVSVNWKYLKYAIWEIFKEGGTDDLTYRTIFRNFTLKCFEHPGPWDLPESLRPNKAAKYMETDSFQQAMRRRWTNNDVSLIMFKDIWKKKAILDERYDEDLISRLYQLFKQLEYGLPAIRDVMSFYLIERGKALVTDPNRSKDPVEFVQGLLDEALKYDGIIVRALGNDKAFKDVLKDSFGHFINLNTRSPEYISVFLDDKMRKLQAEDFQVFKDDKVPKIMMMISSLDQPEVFMFMFKDLWKKAILDERYEDLISRLYQLFNQLGLPAIRDVMSFHLIERGKALVTDPNRSKDPVEFVQGLLDEALKYDGIIVRALGNDKAFEDVLYDSFGRFINLNERSPQYISVFLDHKMRKLQAEDFEDFKDDKIPKIMTMINRLDKPEVFEVHYSKHLAMRLLEGKTVSIDAEKSIVTQMKTKTVCSGSYITKLEAMLEDMDTSGDMMDRFYSSHPELVGGRPLFVQPLNSWSWPELLPTASVTCNLPSEMSSLHEQVCSFYKEEARMKLTLQTNMGCGVIAATFGKRKYMLRVSTHHMCIILLFNDAERLTYQEIKAATEIPDISLKRCLLSMTLIRGRNILSKEPIGDDINETDVFFVNDNFSSESCRVNIS